MTFNQLEDFLMLKKKSSISCCCVEYFDSDCVYLLFDSFNCNSSVVMWFVKRCISFLAVNKASLAVLIINSNSVIFLFESSDVFFYVHLHVI